MLWMPGGFQPSRAALDASTSGPDTTTGLVSYWLMNDGSGSTGVDSGPGGHNMSLNVPSWTSDYYVFGPTTFGLVTDHADYNFGSTMTGFCWISASAASDAWFMSQWISWGMTTSNTGSFNTLRFVAADDGAFASGHQKQYIGSQVCFDSTFHSVAARFNAGVIDLFVDGVKDTSVTKVNDDPITTLFNESQPLAFGTGYYGGGFNPMPSSTGGKKFRLYNIAKSDADIAAMHALGA